MAPLHPDPIFLQPQLLPLVLNYTPTNWAIKASMAFVSGKLPTLCRTLAYYVDLKQGDRWETGVVGLQNL